MENGRPNLRNSLTLRDLPPTPIILIVAGRVFALSAELALPALSFEYLYFLPKGQCREGKPLALHSRRTRARQK